MKKTFSFDAGHSICTAIYKNKVFTGEAHCHPEDADFESERVGLYIAEVRTDINILTYIRDCELKPAYNALNHIQHSFIIIQIHMKRSTFEIIIRLALIFFIQL